MHLISWFLAFSSRECQIEDWPSHRSSCQLIQTTSTQKVVTFDETRDTDCCVLKSEHAVQSSIADKSRCHQIVAKAMTSDMTSPITSDVSFKQADYMHAECNSSDHEGDVTDTCVDKERVTCVGETLSKTENSEAIKIKSVKNLDVHCPIQNIQNEQQVVSPRSNDTAGVAPAIDRFQITVRSGSDSLIVPLQRSWSAEEILCEISSVVKIIPEKLRLISSGKQITAENLLWAVSRSKPIFLAIGEKAENEDGLDAGDISVITKQLMVERNVAVRALRQTSDLVDAILLIANK